MSGLDRVLDALRSRGLEPRKNGTQWACRCPAHDDRNPSLYVRQGNEGALVHCYRGCAPNDVLSAIGLESKQLFDDYREAAPRPVAKEAPYKPPKQGREVARYSYTDEAGEALFEVVRYEPKTFLQQQPNGAWGVEGVRRVPYNLPAVIAVASKGGTVYITEGEKDADRLNNDADIADGSMIVATCNPGGAGKWRDEYSVFLKGAHVVVVADKDDTGKAHAAAVARSVRPHAASVRVVEAAQGKDLFDHLEAGLTLAQLVNSTNAAEKVKEEKPAESDEPLKREDIFGSVPVDASSPVTIIRQKKFLTVEELLELDFKPSTEVAPGITDDGVTLLASPPKGAKTITMLALAISLATGRPFMGKFGRRERYRVAVISEEDPPALTTDRIERLCHAMGIDPGELSGWLLVSPRRGFRFGRLFARVVKETIDILRDFRPQFVFIDTVRQVADIEDSWRDTEVRRFFNDWIYPLRDVLMCAVVLSAHTIKEALRKRPEGSITATVAGSIDYIAAVDNVIVLGSGAGPNDYTFNVAEVRSGQSRGEAFAYRLVDWEHDPWLSKQKKVALEVEYQGEIEEGAGGGQQAPRHHAAVEFVLDHAPISYTAREVTEGLAAEGKELQVDTVKRALKNAAAVLDETTKTDGSGREVRAFKAKTP